MRNFKDAFQTSKQSFICPFSIYMTVPLKKNLCVIYECFFSFKTLEVQHEVNVANV